MALPYHFSRTIILHLDLLQAPVKGRMSVSDFIVPHRHANRFSVPHQDTQMPGSGDPGVEQIALQHDIVLGRKGHHHGGIF